MINKRKAFINGKIYTVDNSNPWAEALFVEGNYFKYVGTNEEVKQLIDSSTEIIDLKGHLVLPGFIDSHLHLMMGGFSLREVNLATVKSKKEFQNRLVDYVDELNPKFVKGGGWDHEIFNHPVLPDKDWIDEVVPDRPVFLTRLDLHMGLANSKALELAGITGDSVNPEGGVIQRDSAGKLTGILKDEAMQLIYRQMPQPTEDASIKAFKAALNEFKKFGITSVHDISRPRDLSFYHQLFLDGKLTCRINTITPITELESLINSGISFGFGNEYIKTGSVKAFSDGSLGSNTAWLFENYKDDPSTNGLPTDIVNSGRLKELTLKADQNKIQIATHAIGDKANDYVCSLYENATRENNKWERRHRIEHAQHMKHSQITRMKNENIIASMQPVHLMYDGVWCENKLNNDQLNSSYLIKSLLNAGVKVCFGSDWTVAPLNPLMGIFAAVTRRTNKGNNHKLVAIEGISVADAIKCYTLNAAYASYEEKIKGSIEAGKLADFIVLDKNIFELLPEAIIDTKIIMTVFDGEVINSI
ncbi:MAG: amidohydrolase [Melioribacteraceae bacterium]|nr:amidohydrolase [Melioribacteraceae bacterium]MCF8355350.1 amidohydrolase [Melioribacteraceae bacterium]MCF8396410.1 amidohydrolase [Melioribacteraceae bacterium]MCF8417856.1 amidohydrolase [Melioribacteraceae bacterium]